MKTIIFTMVFMLFAVPCSAFKDLPGWVFPPEEPMAIERVCAFKVPDGRVYATEHEAVTVLWRLEVHDFIMKSLKIKNPKFPPSWIFDVGEFIATHPDEIMEFLEDKNDTWPKVRPCDLDGIYIRPQ